MYSMQNRVSFWPVLLSSTDSSLLCNEITYLLLGSTFPYDKPRLKYSSLVRYFFITRWNLPLFKSASLGMFSFKNILNAPFLLSMSSLLISALQNLMLYSLENLRIIVTLMAVPKNLSFRKVNQGFHQIVYFWIICIRKLRKYWRYI